MQTCAVIEIEEGGMNVVVGSRVGGETRVLRSIRVDLADLATETVENALRNLDETILAGVKGVHVVIADRRAQHFNNTIPRMTSRDSRAFVKREAMRLGSLQGVDSVLATPRIIKHLPGRKFEITTQSLPVAAWSQLADAFERCEIKVAGLYTAETCLSMAAKASKDELVAVMEYNEGRVRFVLCENKHPVQVRRFLIGSGGSVNSSALVTQLMMELPRTMDWLRDTEQELPKRLLLGARLPIDDDAIDLLRGDDLEAITRAELPVIVPETEASPGLGVATLLDQVCSGVRIPSLLGTDLLQMPWAIGRLVTVAAAACLGLICSYSALVDGQAIMDVSNDRDVISQQMQILDAKLLAAQEARARPERRETDPTLIEAYGLRRPLSRLISEMSNLGVAEVHLEEVTFASHAKTVVRGFVECDDRRTALDVLALFSERLESLPYLKSDGHSEIREQESERSRFSFKIAMTWRRAR
jgi:hypothetical protein